MSNAAAVRLQIEASLAPRIAGALTPRPRMVRDVVATGVETLDSLLDGGMPVGAITELVGVQCSGRTTLALSVLAEMTQAGKMVAWVDASDALDPVSAAAAGVDLSRQLWVRCGEQEGPGKAEPVANPPMTPTSGAALLVEGSRTAAPSGGCGSPHPRGEVRGLSEAVDTFLQTDTFSRPAPPRDPVISRKNRMIGTPSAPNRKLLDRVPQDARPLPRRARDREEQVPTDRQPTRRQMLNVQRQTCREEKGLQAAQIRNTADMAANMPRAGAWTDNANNLDGRSLATPPNAIAAGMPRFQEMEVRAAGQGHGLQHDSLQWRPKFDGSAFQTPEASRPTTENFAASAEARQVDRSSAMLPFPVVRKPLRHEEEPGREGVRQREVNERRASSLAGTPPRGRKHKRSPVWLALDQALRATDLLLAAGGFSALVLDLGDIPPEFVWRIPLATWFRFRAAADKGRTVFLLLTQHACARSSAEIVLRLLPAEIKDAGTVLTGVEIRITVERRRFEAMAPDQISTEPVAVHTLHLVPARKQPQRETQWQRSSAWTGAGRDLRQGASR